jgi:hypothetical protein
MREAFWHLRVDIQAHRQFGMSFLRSMEHDRLKTVVGRGNWEFGKGARSVPTTPAVKQLASHDCMGTSYMIAWGFTKQIA